jgi:hypothetical protein
MMEFTVESSLRLQPDSVYLLEAAFVHFEAVETVIDEDGKQAVKGGRVCLK